MQEPKYSLKEFAAKKGVSYEMLRSRHANGHKLPMPFSECTFKTKGGKWPSRYNYSDLEKWYNDYQPKVVRNKT